MASVVSASGSLSGVVMFAVGDIDDVRSVCSCGTFLDFLLFCMTILIIRRCVDWRFLFISSVIVHVPEVYKRDGVTVASKSLSLSRSGCLGDIDFCLGLVMVAHALVMWWSRLGLRFEGDEFGRRI